MKSRRARAEAPSPPAPALREAFGFLVTWAGLGTLLAWGLGRLLNDRLGWSQYLWWIPSAAALAIGAASLVLAGLLSARRGSRRRTRHWGARFVLLCALAGAGAWTALVEWKFLGRGPAGASAAERVLFWNMAAKDAPGAVRLLERQQADLIVLANPPYSSTRGEIEAALAASHTLAELPECLIAWRGEVAGSGWTSLGLAAARPGMDPTQGGAAIDHGWAAWARLSAEDEPPLVVWVLDLPADPGLSRPDLMRRAKRAIEAAPESFPEPDLIVGDFNTPRGSASLRVLVGPMQEAFAARGRGAGGTWPRRLPLWALDQMFMGDALRPVAARVIDPGAGTHRVLIAEVGRADP